MAGRAGMDSAEVERILMEQLSVRKALEAAADIFEEAPLHQQTDLRKSVVRFLAEFCGQFESDIDERIE